MFLPRQFWVSMDIPAERNHPFGDAIECTVDELRRLVLVDLLPRSLILVDSLPRSLILVDSLPRSLIRRAHRTTLRRHVVTDLAGCPASAVTGGVARMMLRPDG